MNKWHIVSEDGNPKTAGQYFVIVFYHPWEFGAPVEDKLCGCVDVRDFMDAKQAQNWVMDDQPDEGLVWTEQTGSCAGESVYAWLELDEAELPVIPENVVMESRYD